MKFVWIVVAIVGVAILWYGVQFVGCSKNAKSENVVLETPKDTHYIPVHVKNYRPSSLPFSKKSSGVKLPIGIKEKDVKKVVSIGLAVKPDSNGFILDLNKLEGYSGSIIDVIETANGEIFIAKDSLIKFVTVTLFEPQVVNFGINIGLGCSFGSLRDGKVGLLPMGIASLVDWNIYGLNFHVPILTVDLEGIGIGLQTNLYHDIYIGVLRKWNYSGECGIKGVVGFMF